MNTSFDQGIYHIDPTALALEQQELTRRTLIFQTDPYLSGTRPLLHAPSVYSALQN